MVEWDRRDGPTQDQVRDWFDSLGTGPATLLHGSFKGDGWRVGVYSALAPVQYRTTAVSKPGWDLLRGTHGPGFAQGYEGDELVTTYVPAGSGAVEPIVIDRDFHGVRRGYRELAEEFRLFHNLYGEPGSAVLLKFDDAGLEAEAAELLSDRVTVQTALLRQYQAARQLDLLLFIDSTVQFQGPIPDGLSWGTEFYNGVLAGGELRHAGVSFTRFLATRVIPPPPIERCGIWPYEPEDDHYPEFIIGSDDAGSPIRYSCDPSRLDNYFGLNPGAPNFLTPVHFRRDVLGRYYDRPDLYRVGDGEVRCAGLWSLRVDTDRANIVTVYLGDLGEYLPQGERDHWRAHNIPGDGRVSDANFRRSILAQFAPSEAADARFRSLYGRVQAAWSEAFGWRLWRDPHEADTHLLDSVRLPLHDTEREFEILVATLAKLLVDLLDARALDAQLPPGASEERGIAKLERWLGSNGLRDAIATEFLRALYSVRSKAAAHAKGSSYSKSVERLVGDRKRGSAALFTLEAAVSVLESLLDFASSQAESPAEGSAPRPL